MAQWRRFNFFDRVVVTQPQDGDIDDGQDVRSLPHSELLVRGKANLCQLALWVASPLSGFPSFLSARFPTGLPILMTEA